MNRTIRRIKQQLLADKRKLGLMVSLLGLALLLWGRLLLKDVPRTAVADPEPKQVAEAEPEPDTETIRRRTRPTVRVADRPMRYRDLFALDSRYFPLAEDASQKPESPDKSPGDLVDEQDERRRLRLAVESQARSLKLQSTMLGKDSRALINGVLLEPGQTIEGFELKEVRSRQVTLVMRGIEVTLEM